MLNGRPAAPHILRVLRFFTVVTFGVAILSCHLVMPDEEESVESPSFIPEPGVFAEATTVAISCATDGAAIYYTTDGSSPGVLSTLYTGPISLYDTTTLRSIALKNLTSSSVSVGVYIINNPTAPADVGAQVPTPVFDPPPDTYVQSVDVTISCEVVGADFFYTLDGSPPSTATTLYEGPVTIATPATIKAIASKEGMTDSSVASGDYALQAALPVSSVSSGSYGSAFDVTLTCATAASQIYYTLDGSEPTDANTLYGGLINIDSDLTLKAVAVSSGYVDSDVASFSFTIDPFVDYAVLLDDLNGYSYVWNLFARDDLLYVASSFEGLNIYDIQDPASISLVGSVHAGHEVTDVWCDGNYAYLAGDQFFIADISNPAAPNLVGRVYSYTDSVVASGSYAYAGSWDAFVAIDVSEPNIAEVGFEVSDANRQFRGLFVDNGFTYYVGANVGTGFGSLDIYDASDPLDQSFVKTVDFATAEANEVWVSDGYAYVSDRENLQILDVSVPSAATIDHSVALNDVEDIWISGTTAYCADTTDGVVAVDISAPLTASIDGTFFPNEIPVSICVPSDGSNPGGYAYVGTTESLEVVDVSDPASMSLVTSSFPQTYYRSVDVVVDGTNAFVANTGSGWHIIDVESPAYSAITTTIPGGWIMGIDVNAAGDAAYILGPSVLRTYDVSVPATTSSLSGDVALPYEAEKIKSSGNFVFLASYDYFLSVDVTDPASPGAPNDVYCGESGTSTPYLSVNGNLAFMTAGSMLHVFDITTPASPTKLVSEPLSDVVRGLASDGNYVCAAVEGAGFGQILVIDVSTPSTPVLAQTVDLDTEYPVDLFFEGGRLFVSEHSGIIEVIRIDSPPPYVESIIDTDRGEGQLFVLNGTIYVASESYGLVIIGEP